MNRRYNQPWGHNNEPIRSNNQVKTCEWPWIMTRFSSPSYICGKGVESENFRDKDWKPLTHSKLELFKLELFKWWHGSHVGQPCWYTAPCSYPVGVELFSYVNTSFCFNTLFQYFRESTNRIPGTVLLSLIYLRTLTAETNLTTLYKMRS